MHWEFNFTNGKHLEKRCSVFGGHLISINFSPRKWEEYYAYSSIVRRSLHLEVGIISLPLLRSKHSIPPTHTPRQIYINDIPGMTLNLECPDEKCTAGGGEREREREWIWVDLGCWREIAFWVHFGCWRGICILGRLRMFERDWISGTLQMLERDLHLGLLPTRTHKPQSITVARLAYWIVRSEWEQLPKVVVAKECLNSSSDDAFRSKSKDWTHPRCNTSPGLVCDRSTWFDRNFSAVPGGITEGLGFRV